MITLKGKFRSKEQRWDSMIVAWKALEKALQQAHVAADLVQLNGYYQYSSQLAIRAEFKSVQRDHAFANVIRRVSSGEGVGATMALKDLSKIWDMPEKSALIVLSLLRHNGFEVRNQRTNPQIAAGHVLIPYPFPTLNRQSVQFHKSLH